MISIAIDGPAGAGKSTIAKMVAKKLGYIYVDTGALYRTIGLACAKKDIDIYDIDKLNEVLAEIKLELIFENGVQKVLLNGEDVSEQIRTPQAGMMASKVSAIPRVREYLLDTQRNLSKTNNILMDGRDIGTVILPNADVKIFLTASAEVRAKRRYDEFVAKGSSISFEEVLADMKERDYNDSHRDIAPLKPAEDSVLADTSNDTLDEAVQRILDIIKNKLSKKI